MATTQQYAYLSERVYEEPNINKVYQAKDNNFYTAPDGHKYRVLENMSNPRTGYQGTIYQDMNSGEIIVAHRGTEHPKQDLRDALTDLSMVRSRTNAQEADAMRLVEHAKQFAQRQHQDNPNQPPPSVSITGHSLGATLAQITAYRSGLYGEAFNPYGAAAVHPKMPRGGLMFKNHFMAGDAVSAAANHYGSIEIRMTERSVHIIKDHSKSTLSKASDMLNEHSISNYTGSQGQNILRDEYALSRARVYHKEVEQFRNEVRHDRRMVGLLLNSGNAVATINEIHKLVKEDQQPHVPLNHQREEQRIMDDSKIYRNNSIGDIPQRLRSENEAIPPQYRQLHSQVDQHIRQLYQERAIPFSNGGENTVMSCTAQAYQRGFEKIDQIKVQDGEIALFTRQPFGYQVAQLNAMDAANTSVQTSLQQMNDWTQQMQVTQLAQVQNQSQGMSMAQRIIP